jgi:LDH2 family malate/lactate/ureidoglycolate dehydrogenase
VKANTTTLQSLDRLRATAISLLIAHGLEPTAAARTAELLLWHDAVKLPRLGIATLSSLLERMASGEIGTRSDGPIVRERAATAVIDGRKVVPLLVLNQAADLASQKAREYGAAVVRVAGVGQIESAASAVYQVGIGPTVALAVGPRRAWSVALPSSQGFPVLADHTLGSPESLRDSVGTIATVLAKDEWLIHAVSVTAMETLADFHRRISAQEKHLGPAVLLPSQMIAFRNVAQDRGVTVSKATQMALKACMARVSVSPD